MRIIIYTNILTPYRKYFFDMFYNICKEKNIFFKVFVMADTEKDRNWKYNDLKASYTKLLKNINFEYKNIYIHYNPDLKKNLNELKPTHVICAGSYLCPGIKKILNLKDKYNYEAFFWSESHLKEERQYSVIKRLVRTFIRNYIYKKFDGFWYAGELSLEFINKYANAKSSKIFVPNLVDNRVFDYHNFSDDVKEKTIKKYKLENRKKITLICPARLIRVKGIDKFINLIKNQQFKNKITILIPGDGELREEVSNEAKKYNIDIRLLGFLYQKEIAKLYVISDFFLMPSISDANPLTCIEALWAGLPLIVSEHVGNYKEVVNETINGFVFNYNDSSKINSIFFKILNWTMDDYRKAKDFSYNLATKKYLAQEVIENILIELK